MELKQLQTQRETETEKNEVSKMAEFYRDCWVIRAAVFSKNNI